MEIEKIETRECESTLAQIVLIGLSIILIVLSVSLVLGILAGKETKTLGILMGVAFLVLGIMLGTLKSGFIAKEVVTAIEEK
ncbi:MAG: hypothetical protein V3R93_06200 [Candidatus Hydrothermarchaeaceae archaeon]